jgi:hypothetical protein
MTNESQREWMRSMKLMMANRPIVGKWLRRPGWVLAVAAAVLLSSCSTLQLGYRNADTLAYWWLNKYFAFDEFQSPVVRSKIGSFLQWHRQRELPRTAQLLESAARLATTTEPSGTQVCNLWGEARLLYRASLERFMPDAAEVALGLTPTQLAQLKSEMEKSNRDFDKKYRDGNPAEVREKRNKATVERLEFLYGEVTAEQEALAAKLMMGSPWDGQRWAQERARRQRELVEVLSTIQGQPKPTVLQRLWSYNERVEKNPNPATQNWLDEVARFNCEFSAQMHKAMTPEQRAFARTKLQGYANDLRTLHQASNSK